VSKKWRKKERRKEGRKGKGGNEKKKVDEAQLNN